MNQYFSKATYQRWIALMCIPLIMVGMTFTTGCNSQTVVDYVELAVDTASSLAAVVPSLAPILPILQVANAGLSGWKAGQSVPQNVIAALQSALSQASASFPNITPDQKSEVSILLAAIVTALDIAGVSTMGVSSGWSSLDQQKMVAEYSGKSPGQLRKQFNKQAKAAGVKTI